MKPVRIACVRYLNTVPLIEGLEKLRGVELVPMVPSRIADEVRSGRAEVGLVSLVDAAGGDLALVPAGMIGCDGPTLTVRLFSAVPLERVTAVHADTDSHTSVVLCRILLSRLFGVSPRVVGFDARERVEVGRHEGTEARRHEVEEKADLDSAWPETVLLIGDKVVTDAPPGARYPHQLDLGEAWKGMTGLPFVYAMWMCRADRAGSAEVQTAAAVLERQRRHNATRLDWIAAKHAPAHRWPLELARKYLGSRLRFEVGERERAAVGRFFEEAVALGALAAGEVRWAPGPGERAGDWRAAAPAL